jgi:hypothetical protein
LRHWNFILVHREKNSCQGKRIYLNVDKTFQVPKNSTFFNCQSSTESNTKAVNLGVYRSEHKTFCKFWLATTHHWKFLHLTTFWNYSIIKFLCVSWEYCNLLILRYEAMNYALQKLPFLSNKFSSINSFSGINRKMKIIVYRFKLGRSSVQYLKKC